MPKSTTLPLTQNHRNVAATLANADSFTAINPGTAPTNTKLLMTAGSDGSIVKSLIACTDATAAAQTFGLWISTDSGTTKHLIGVTNVPLNSGYTGAVINVDCLSNSFLIGLTYDQAGRAILPLQASAQLYIGCLTTAVAASKTLWITGVVEDF